MSRLFLSPPHMEALDLERLREAFASNWISTAGPDLEAFQTEFARTVGSSHAAALGSGTAGLHLAMRLAGVGPGDEVLCSTLTFVASANPILYQGARPVFVDSDRSSWNMDPALLAGELDACARRGRLPRAVEVVHLFGQSADLDPILEACDRHGVPLIEDAAESLGTLYKGRAPGTRGLFGVFSFSGNKIITTSGGGMLVSNDGHLIERARFLSMQARDPAPHYQHSQAGYNYRMSNLLAALGRSQLRSLPGRVARRRHNFEVYRRGLAGVPGLSFMPEAPYGTSSRWLSVLTIDPDEFGADRERVRLHLESRDIESRPVWKPMHLQPLFEGCRRVGGGVAESLFEQGLCLPSGSQMSDDDLHRVIEAIGEVPRRRTESTRKMRRSAVRGGAR